MEKEVEKNEGTSHVGFVEKHNSDIEIDT